MNKLRIVLVHMSDEVYG